MVALKTIKLDRTQQRDLLILIVVSHLAMMFLLNLFWEPLIFMVFMSYIVINKNNALTKNELLAACLVVCFLVYSITARLFGMGPGLMVVVPILFVVSLLYLSIWRKKR